VIKIAGLCSKLMRTFENCAKVAALAKQGHEILIVLAAARIFRVR